MALRRGSRGPVPPTTNAHVADRIALAKVATILEAAVMDPAVASYTDLVASVRQALRVARSALDATPSDEER